AILDAGTVDADGAGVYSGNGVFLLETLRNGVMEIDSLDANLAVGNRYFPPSSLSALGSTSGERLIAAAVRMVSNAPYDPTAQIFAFTIDPASGTRTRALR